MPPNRPSYAAAAGMKKKESGLLLFHLIISKKPNAFDKALNNSIA
jgi:hypothetical protein